LENKCRIVESENEDIYPGQEQFSQAHNHRSGHIMSAKKKRKKRKRRQNSGIHNPPESINRTAQVGQLIEKGRIKEALNLAKQQHKSLGTKESETILVEAYVARIRELKDKGLYLDAKSLLHMVNKRYLMPQELFSELNTVISIQQGSLDDLVRPLNTPDTSREDREIIEKMIRTHLIDLQALAACKTLSDEHPLKIGARAAAHAFQSVTSRPVEDQEIALPQISSRSPLASWKMLIRAIASFYRHEDGLCEKYLDAVDPQSAPSRIVPVIRAMISEKHNETLNKSARLLIERVNINQNRLRSTLQSLDEALARKRPRKSLFNEIRGAVAACRQTAPDLVDRLKQHITVRAQINGYDPNAIAGAMGGSALKDAYFFRLQARAAETTDQLITACMLWDEFRKHAVQEGLFSGNGKEESVIYLHIAELLQRMPEDELRREQANFKWRLSGFEPVDGGVKKDNLSDPYFLYPERLFRLATELDPDDETFKRWLEWSQKSGANWKDSDRVALAWHAAKPASSKPLLHLMASAEKRNAFKKALGYLERAEKLDGLNPEVKKARLRLLTAIAIRHLKQEKTHLAQKDFAEIQALPQSTEGDNPAFIVALKSVAAKIDGQHSQYGKWEKDLIGILNSKPAAEMVLEAVFRLCGVVENKTFRNQWKLPPGEKLLEAVARGCSMGENLGIPVTIPEKWRRKLKKLLKKNRDSLDPASIRNISEAAFRSHDLELAYAASGAGLIQGGPATARFLLIRARSLPPWESNRKKDCIAAAIELARSQRDMDLIDEAVELRHNGTGLPFMDLFFNDPLYEHTTSMDENRLNNVLEREKRERKYPFEINWDHRDLDTPSLDSECSRCDVRNCPNRKAPYMSNTFDEPDEMNDLLEDEEDFPGIPEELIPLFMDILNETVGKKKQKSKRSKLK